MGPIVNELGRSSGAVITRTSVEESMFLIGIGSPNVPLSHTTLMRPRWSSPHRQTSLGHWNASPARAFDDAIELAAKQQARSIKRKRVSIRIVNPRRASRHGYYVI